MTPRKPSADKKKTAIWVRVSGPDQTTENQLEPLREYVARRGLELVQVFDVSSVSAWRGGQERFLGDVLQQARLGRFEILVCWALDRLSRQGPEAILRTVRQFSTVGCEVWSLQEPWTEAGGELRDLLLAIVGWVAQTESQRRSERTKAGLERARSEGKRLGRPPGAKDKKARKKTGYLLRYSDRS